MLYMCLFIKFLFEGTLSGTVKKCIFRYYKRQRTPDKNRQSREIGSIGYSRQRKTK